MKIHFDKDASIISLTIAVGLMLMFSVFQGWAQGQSYKNILVYKKVQNSIEHYTLCEPYMQILKGKNCISQNDTAKKMTDSKETNSMKKIKKAVTSMLIAQHSFDNNLIREYCFLPGSLASNYERYEENK